MHSLQCIRESRTFSCLREKTAQVPALDHLTFFVRFQPVIERDSAPLQLCAGRRKHLQRIAVFPPRLLVCAFLRWMFPLRPRFLSMDSSCLNPPHPPVFFNSPLHDGFLISVRCTEVCARHPPSSSALRRPLFIFDQLWCRYPHPVSLVLFIFERREFPARAHAVLVAAKWPYFFVFHKLCFPLTFFAFSPDACGRRLQIFLMR